MPTLHASALFFAVVTLSTVVHAAGAGEGSTETLASGVVVKHTVRGEGAQPSATDTVRVHYRGTLTDGTEFDSSYKRKQAISFPLNRVVRCWTEGVQTMKVGGKATLTCPSQTAYGARGVPGVIPPDSTLVFEIELLGIDK